MLFSQNSLSLSLQGHGEVLHVRKTSAVMHSISCRYVCCSIVSGEQCCDVCTCSCGATVHIRPRSPHFEVSRSHAIRHTHLIWFLWTCTHTITDAATRTSHNEHKRQISMPSAGFKPIILPIKQLHNYTIDCTATRIVVCTYYIYIYLHDIKKAEYHGINCCRLCSTVLQILKGACCSEFQTRSHKSSAEAHCYTKIWHYWSKRQWRQRKQQLQCATSTC